MILEAYKYFCLIFSTEHQNTSFQVIGGGSYPGSARTSATASLASSRESSCASCPGITAPYRVVMLGSAGVGKSSLISQFMTSEYLHAYDMSIGNLIIIFYGTVYLIIINAALTFSHF